MCVYLAASFSTDGMVNAVTFYLIAQFCYLINRKQKVSLKRHDYFYCIELGFSNNENYPYVLLVGFIVVYSKGKNGS